MKIRKEILHNVFLMEREGRRYLMTKSRYPPYYGEKKVEGYREWIAGRSKFAAMVLNGHLPEINHEWKVLYLGAASGTTVSHFSDMFDMGIIYAVEYSAKPFSKLLDLAMERKNVIPLLRDASKPETYNGIVEKVDFIYQDISQKEQIKIFSMNTNIFLKESGSGLLMVKTRSIDSTAEPREVFKKVMDELKENELRVIRHGTLEPYHKDHFYTHLVKK